MVDFSPNIPDLGTAPLGTGGDDQRSAFTQHSANWTSLSGTLVWDAATFNLTAKASLEITDFLSISDSGELTVSGGIVTATGSFHRIDTEGDAATDDLNTINGATFGRILILRSASSGRDTTLKDAVGNLLLAGDFTFLTASDTIILFGDGSNWIELSRSTN